MKPQDIRINNYIQYDGREGVVRAVNHRGVTIHFEEHITTECKYVGNELQGIPLTEQWLKDFGFKVNGVMTFTLYRVFKLSKSNYGYQLHCGNLFTTMTTEEIGVEITHVHQLQNLFFCLTGKELTK